jgi:hypothetical protein
LDREWERSKLDPIAELADDRPIRRLYRALRLGAAQGKTAANLRFDWPGGLSGEVERLSAAPDFKPQSDPATLLHSGRTNGQQMIWLLVAFGLSAFASGVGLAGWSLAVGETLLWHWGIIATLAGQGALILGLVFAVARLWITSRYAHQRLQEAHVQLGKLDRTAESLLGQRHASAHAFYGELVRGASPEMLLASLRGQVDQFASRVAGSS